MQSLFDGLDSAAQAYPQRSFRRGEFIYSVGEESNNLWLLNAGIVGLFHISGSGKETLLRVFGPRVTLAHRSILDGGVHHATAIALSTAEAIAIPRTEFLAILNARPELLLALSRQLAQDLREAEERIARVMDRTASQRVAEALVYLRLRYPEHNWTRREIAEFSETTEETCTRVMGQLEARGLLVKQGRRFDLPAPDKLLDEAIA